MLKNLQSKIYKLSETYWKKWWLDLPYFLKNWFWLYLSQFAVIFKFFTLSILLTRFLTQEQFGQWSFIMWVIWIFAISWLPWLSSSIIQWIVKKQEGTYKQAIKLAIKYSLLWSLWLIIASLYAYVYWREYASFIFLFIWLLFPFYTTSTYFIFYFNWKELFNKKAKYESFFHLFQLTITWLSIYITKDLTISIISFMLSNIIIWWYYSYYLIPKHYLKNNISNNELINFWKKISFGQIPLIIANHFDKIIIWTYLSFEELAIYTIATLLPDQVKNITGPISQMFLPKLTKQNTTKKDIYKHLPKFFFITFILIITYIILAPFIFKLFYPWYLESALLYSQIFMLSFIAFPSSLIITYLNSKRKTTFINIFNTILPILLVILPLIWILLFWIVWAIIWRITTRIIWLLLSIFLLRKS